MSPTQHTQVVKRDVTNTLDSSTYRPESFQNWGDTSTREAIRNRFVTGDWGKGTLHWFGSFSHDCPHPLTIALPHGVVQARAQSRTATRTTMLTTRPLPP